MKHRLIVSALVSLLLAPSLGLWTGCVPEASPVPPRSTGGASGGQAGAGGSKTGAGGRDPGAGGQAGSAGADGRGGNVTPPPLVEPRLDGGGPELPEPARDGGPMTAGRDATTEGGGDVPPPPACPIGVGEAMPNGPMPDVLSVAVTNDTGQPLVKGQRASMRFGIRHGGASGRLVTLSAFIDSQRFSDYVNVPFAKQTVALCPGMNEVALEGGPFFTDPTRGKSWALGRGAYTVSSVTIEGVGDMPAVDNQFEGAAFSVGRSNAIFVPVLSDPQYLAMIQGFTGTPESYVAAVYGHATQVFTPSTADPDGPGTFQTFPNFDAMMNTRHVFKHFTGTVATADRADGLAWCRNATAAVRQALGLASAWPNAGGTQAALHGFDYAVTMAPNLAGGWACSTLNVQVSGFLNRDAPRQQLILIHESAHVFGAPHCDNVGNGSGGSLQGFVMCAGEKHARYPGAFVYHATSRALMNNRWD